MLAALAASPMLAAPGVQAAVCAEAAATAEREAGVPAGLLLAIGRIESGRRDPESGQVVPWPWALNALGEGRFHAAAEDAIRDVRAIRARGVASVDVGCFQVNLMHHAGAFATLEEAFDPLVNARYAARFLTQLRERWGGWEQAVAAYHSATPAFGEPYRQRVMAAWAGGPLPAGPVPSGPVAPPGTRTLLSTAPLPLRQGVAPAQTNTCGEVKLSAGLPLQVLQSTHAWAQATKAAGARRLNSGAHAWPHWQASRQAL